MKDLQLLESSFGAKLDQAISNQKQDTADTRAEFRQEFATTRAECRQEFAAMRAEFQQEFAAMRQEFAAARAESRQLFVGLICLLVGLGFMAAKDLLRFL